MAAAPVAVPVVLPTAAVAVIKEALQQGGRRDAASCL